MNGRATGPDPEGRPGRYLTYRPETFNRPFPA